MYLCHRANISVTSAYVICHKWSLPRSGKFLHDEKDVVHRPHAPTPLPMQEDGAALMEQADEAHVGVLDERVRSSTSVEDSVVAVVGAWGVLAG